MRSPSLGALLDEEEAGVGPDERARAPEHRARLLPSRAAAHAAPRPSSALSEKPLALEQLAARLGALERVLETDLEDLNRSPLDPDLADQVRRRARFATALAGSLLQILRWPQPSRSASDRSTRGRDGATRWGCCPPPTG